MYFKFPFVVMSVALDKFIQRYILSHKICLYQFRSLQISYTATTRFYLVHLHQHKQTQALSTTPPGDILVAPAPPPRPTGRRTASSYPLPSSAPPPGRTGPSRRRFICEPAVDLPLAGAVTICEADLYGHPISIVAVDPAPHPRRSLSVKSVSIAGNLGAEWTAAADTPRPGT